MHKQACLSASRTGGYNDMPRLIVINDFQLRFG